MVNVGISLIELSQLSNGSRDASITSSRLEVVYDYYVCWFSRLEDGKVARLQSS